MENLSSFTIIVILAFGILQIILFFKLWGMTNDIRIIKTKYLESLSIEPENVKLKINSEVKIEDGALVVNIKTGKQMRRKEINPASGKFNCYTNGGTVFEGDFDESEIKLFEE